MSIVAILSGKASEAIRPTGLMIQERVIRNFDRTKGITNAVNEYSTSISRRHRSWKGTPYMNNKRLEDSLISKASKALGGRSETLSGESFGRLRQSLSAYVISRAWTELDRGGVGREIIRSYASTFGGGPDCPNPWFEVGASSSLGMIGVMISFDLMPLIERHSSHNMGRDGVS